MYIEQVNSPQDIKRFSAEQLRQLAGEVRNALLTKLSAHGGHVGPNLGMVEANAKRFIFLEYFIIAEGLMWGEVLKLLKEKVEEGVEVRVLYDGTNELFNLSYQYL